MATRHLLYLTNENLVSLVARAGRIASRRVFPSTAAGRHEFEGHLQGLRAVPTHVITDLAEEDFRVDTIPHLGAGDREAVLARKLSQYFRNTPFRHAIVQGREADRRRDDRVLYIAITNGELLLPWVEILERLEVPVEGIHSCAAFSGRLLAELRLQFPHTLLVTFRPGEAIRQTYFRQREIKFSRVTPVDPEEGETLGELLASEIRRTWQYLDSQRYFAPADRLDVCVLVHPGDLAAVQPMLRSYDQIEYHVLDIVQVAARIGLNPAPDSSSAEAVLAHLFLRLPGSNHFASPELRRFAQLRSARIAIGATAAAVLASGLAYGGWNLRLAFRDQVQDARTARQVQAARRDLEEIMRSMPSEVGGGEAMRDTVAFFSGSLRDYPTPASLLVPVSAILAGHPKIRLTQVAWQAADDDKATPALVPTSQRQAPPLTATARVAESVPSAVQRPGAEPTRTAFSSGRHAVALLEGTVTVEGLGFREALAQVESLVAAIERLPGYRASVVDSPLDVSSRVAITARLGERMPATSQARFTVRVSRATEPRT